MTDQDASDTKDRCAVVRENENSLMQSARTFTAVDAIQALRNEVDALRALQKEVDALRALQKELGDGSYFAKASDIFPKDSAEHKTFKDIQGKADTFQRVATLDLYDGPRNQFIKHLTDAETESLPDAGSIPTEASQASLPSVSGTDRKACLLQDVPGNKGHQGSDSKNCSAWWGLVYSWMIGKIDNLDIFLKDIRNEDDTDEKQLLKDRLNKAFVFLANGTMGGTSGMRSNDRNILFVPDPHDAYYDSGCNWVIYPILTSEQMLEWKGEPYWVSIFCGENLVGEDKGDIWKDGRSKKTAQQAEAPITNKMPFNSERISVCSTTDLKVVGEGLAEMTLALADLHTRKSSTTAFKARIIDLASTIKQYLVENKKDPLENITEEWKMTEEAIAIIDDFQQHRDKQASQQITTGARQQNQGTFDLIQTGINDLVLHLETKGIDVPIAPRKNHFGDKGKHVCKAFIRQSNPPDPIVVAAKGTNNLNRQWGVRLLSGCSFSSDDDSSSAGNSCSRGIKEYSAGTPMTPDKDFVGATVVTPGRLDHQYGDEDDSLSNEEDDF